MHQVYIVQPWRNKDFVVIHMNGIHMVSVDFCHCQLIPHYKHLLCIAWWPGTLINLKTCATRGCLQQFHLLNLKANVTTFSYYGMLRHMTDNLGLEQIPISYHFDWVESILIGIFRINSMPSCSWHTNSDIPRCWSVMHMYVILEVHQPQFLAPLLSPSELALFLISTYCVTGMMCTQKEHKSSFSITDAYIH